MISGRDGESLSAHPVEHGVHLSGSWLDVSSFHFYSDTGRSLILLPEAVSAITEADVTGGQDRFGT